MKYYDIHGFVIAVDETASSVFTKEYGWAQVENPPEEISLYVKQYEKNKALPTKPAGCKVGMYIPFAENEDTLWYNEGVPLNVVLSYCEGLFWWKNKTMLHAGGVTKNGKALLFTGTGNVGKTSTVLNLLEHGFEYLSDDWVVVGNRTTYPLPKTLHVFDYNLENPEVAKRVLGSKRFLYKPIFKIIDILRNYAPHRYIRYAVHTARPVFHVNIKTLYPSAIIAPPTEISEIFFMERSNSKEIRVHDDIDPKQLAKRMVNVSIYEWHFFFREYSRYVMLYNIYNPRIEEKAQHDEAIMRDTFEKVSLKRVEIPRGIDLTKMQITKILGIE